MKHHKNDTFIECEECGSITEYMPNNIEKQYIAHDNHNYTVNVFLKCPTCGNHIIIDKYNINSDKD